MAAAAPDAPTAHPSAETLAALVHSRSDAVSESVFAHLDACPDCRRVLSAAVESQPSLPGPAPSLSPGDHLGRYELRALLGVGAMGAVYEGFDAQLDRRVALKLLRADATHTEAARASLLAEARLMAKVNHPHVRAVYDAGTEADRTFLVLELVDGQPLSQWLLTHRRWREVAHAFLDAGKGLEAAHQAGLVHRDFKASNVLVDTSGRIRVTDFGLALAGAMPRGELAGTLAFMAPEQRSGLSADARSDQYAFCTAFELALGSDAPAWLRTLLTRGRAANPDARFPSMGALLEALASGLAPRRHRAYFAAAILVVAAAGTAAFVHQRLTRCAIDPSTLAQVWDAPTKAAARDAFAATHLPYAEAAFTRASTLLDAFTARWLSARKDACEAATVRGEQTESLFTARSVCLERRKAELAALTQLFTHADATTVEKAADATEALTRRGLCDTLEELSLQPPAPTASPAYATVQDALAAARALFSRGDAKPAFERLDAVLADARALEHPPTLALVLQLRGALLTQLGRIPEAKSDLDAAILAADRGRAGTTRVDAWNALVDAHLMAADPPGALDAAAHARAALDGLARPAPTLAAELDLVEGRALRISGRFQEALERYTRAKTLAGDDSHLAREADLGLGTALSGLDRTADAIAVLRRVAADTERLDGPAHPSTSIALSSLAAAYADAKQPAEAVPLIRRAIAIREAASGPENRTLAGLHTNLGIMLRRLGQFDEARPHLRQAVAVFEKLDGPDAMRSFFPLSTLGNLDVAQGHPTDGIPLLRQALRIAQKRPVPPRTTVTSRTNLVEALLAAGIHDEAVELAREAFRLAEAPDVKPFDRNAAALCLADTLWRTGHLEESRTRYAALPATTVDPIQRGELALGQARILEREHPDQALALAREARTVLAPDAGENPDRLAQVDALLARLQTPARKR